MKRVTLDPLDATRGAALGHPDPLADPLVDATRRARTPPVDPAFSDASMSARSPRTARWRVADPTPPDPKALDARVSALAANVADALGGRATRPRTRRGRTPRSEPRPFPAADALGSVPASRKKRFHTKASRFRGPIRFVERFPVVAPTTIGEARRRRAASGLSYDAPSKTWTREVFPTGISIPIPRRTPRGRTHTSREDVRVLERWLDTSVADAARMSEPNGETAPGATTNPS